MNNNLRFLRKEHKLTIQEFGDKFGADSRTVVRWESQKITKKLAREIADFFEVTIEEVVGENQEFKEISIGRTGAIDKESAREVVEIKFFLTLRVKEELNTFRNVFVNRDYVISVEMLNEFIEAALIVTDIFSRIHVKYKEIDLEEVFKISDKKGSDYKMRLCALTVDLFHEKYGKLSCDEIRNCIDKVYRILDKYGYDPFYRAKVVFETFLIDLIYSIWNNYDSKSMQNYFTECIIWFLVSNTCECKTIE